MALETLVDRELEGVPRGAELDASVGATMRARDNKAAPTRVADDPGALGVRWGDLLEKHDDYDAAYWQECRALYAGGKRLLGNPELMKRLFPSHAYEAPEVYAARQQRAHYFAYAGTIVDSLLAGLATDPLRVTFGTIGPDGKAVDDGVDPWWKTFIGDVTNESDREVGDGDEDANANEGGCPAHAFLTEVMRECAITHHTWILADMPIVDDQPAIADAATPVDAKPADPEPWLSILPAESVIDWEWEDERRGILKWVLVLDVTKVRATLRDRRAKLRHTFTLWTAIDWTRYVVDVDPKQPPNATDIVQPIAPPKAHDFGRVPIECVSVPEGLWAMGKLHSLAREHFNKRCAMSWAEYKALFAILYEFLDDGDNGGDMPIAGETDRATNQVRSQGYSQLRRGKDRAEWVGPDPGPFVAARESTNDVMREMHRLMYSMALSANMDAAALKRSGDSKKSDENSTRVILAAFSLIVRRTLRKLIDLVSAGRGEEDPPEAKIDGLSNFDVEAVSDTIAEVIQLFPTGLPIKSATFLQKYLGRTYGKILGDSLSTDDREAMEQEIAELVTQEDLAMTGGAAIGAPPPPDPNADQADDEDGVPGGSDPPDDPPPEDDKPDKPPAKPVRRRMIGS